jgi:tetratricopeptide (TPR) repeat protein
MFGGYVMPNEDRICPQCGYRRQPRDLAPDYECPRCGIIYNKYVAPKPPAPADEKPPLTPATASPSPQTESPAAALPVLAEEEPDVLETARELWTKDKPDEAIAELEKYLQQVPDSHAAHLLLAQIYVGQEKPAKGVAAKVQNKLKLPQREKKSPKANQQAGKALLHASRARDLGGENDPETIRVLADALMHNKRKEEALTLIEDSIARNPKELSAWEEQIAQFRKRWALGTVWQFFNAAGKLLYESQDVEAIRQRLVRGEIPIRAKCRKNRVGALKSITESIGQQEDRIRILIEPFWYHVKGGALLGACFSGALYALAAGVWYIYSVIKEMLNHEFVAFFFSHLVVMIASIVIFWWLYLGLFLLVLCLASAIAGVLGGLSGAIVGAPVGAVVGLLRWPFIPKLKVPKSLSA